MNRGRKPLGDKAMSAGAAVRAGFQWSDDPEDGSRRLMIPMV
jgi:hypothetical protein